MTAKVKGLPVADDIATIILVIADPVECVQLLARRHRGVPMADILDIAAEVEPGLVEQGLGDLNAFRRELAKVWGL